MNISIIFPMAGLGSRFGYKFKPFLKLTEDTFIEWAKKPFDQYLKNYYLTYYFIVRFSQEETYNISFRLKTLFPNDNVHCICIKDTDGPFQTLQEAIQTVQLNGPAFVCDCDHSINITPMLPYLSKNNILIPTWTIQPDQYPQWGKIKLDEHGSILDFCEKESMEGNIQGLIGCYFFPKIEKLLSYPPLENISCVLKRMLSDGTSLQSIPITEASFFGTPVAVEAFRFKRAQLYTLFIDVDGTLLDQTDGTPLPGTIKQINEWKSQGHRILLTTARKEKHIESLKQTFHQYTIPYDDILYNLSSGPRYVINDRKPYLPFYCMAQGIVVDRNEGIQDIQLPNVVQIKKVLQGASFANVYLVEENGHVFVRKYIPKKKELQVHVDILKRQCEDLKRFHFYKKNLCPTILKEYESPSEYYYDMEYLEGYYKLSEFSSDIICRVLPFILKDLHTHIYCYQKQILQTKRIQWLKDYYEEKLYPKYKSILELDKRYTIFFQSNTIYINGKEYTSIPDALDMLYVYQSDIPELCPSYTCPIHGDLTLENILYNPITGDYKLIDPSGSRYMDAIEMDTAKLFQSLICDYVDWINRTDLVNIENELSFHIESRFLKDRFYCVQHMYSYNEYRKGLFYMATYFIRMVPFMYAKSFQHGLFVLILATHYLESLKNIDVK